ncbi:WhiB family transcriptional regulator [Ilumatobacter sp.]|uniref:WhiB family transcriptional regulator n=1 Tax=Ilumatobacter sp. TaxID=1967498 RepID=UPI003C655BAB
MLTEPQTHTSADPVETITSAAFSPLTGRARCSDGAGTLTHLFFSDEDLDIARAKAICRTCRLSTACLDGAIRRSEAYGVWGGVLLIDGSPTRFARRRGRPPTHRIETVAEEVPIPAHLVA